MILTGNCQVCGTKINFDEMRTGEIETCQTCQRPTPLQSNQLEKTRALIFRVFQKYKSNPLLFIFCGIVGVGVLIVVLSVAASVAVGERKRGELQATLSSATMRPLQIFTSENPHPVNPGWEVAVDGEFVNTSRRSLVAVEARFRFHSRCRNKTELRLGF